MQVSMFWGTAKRKLKKKRDGTKSDDIIALCCTNTTSCSQCCNDKTQPDGGSVDPCVSFNTGHPQVGTSHSQLIDCLLWTLEIDTIQIISVKLQYTDYKLTIKLTTSDLLWKFVIYCKICISRFSVTIGCKQIESVCIVFLHRQIAVQVIFDKTSDKKKKDQNACDKLLWTEPHLHMNPASFPTLRLQTTPPWTHHTITASINQLPTSYYNSLYPLLGAGAIAQC